MTALHRGWARRRFKWVARLLYGDSLPGEAREDGGQVPVVGSNGVFGTHSIANTLSPVLVVGRKGSYGKLNYAESPVFAIDTTYFIDSRSTQSNLKWLYYAMQPLGLDSYTEDSAIPGLAREFVHDSFITVPPPPDQGAIAAFLDRVTAKIDALIAKKERLLALLEEKRTALITRAVTKGLDPTVPMKGAGVEWLAEVPVHWEVRRLKFLCASTPNSIQIGPFGSMLKDLSYSGGSYKVYGQENVISGNFLAGDRWTAREKWAGLSRYEVRSGDILFTRKGSLGNCRLFPDDAPEGIIDSDTIRVRLNSDYLNSHFFVRVLHEATYANEQMTSGRRGAVLGGLNSESIADLVIAVPPVEEQKRINAWIEEQLASIDILTHRILEAIALLREYRTAIISAAVTGQIDVNAEVS